MTEYNPITCHTGRHTH